MDALQWCAVVVRVRQLYAAAYTALFDIKPIFNGLQALTNVTILVTT